MIKKRYDGFTLVELMVTVAIVGILAAIAVPAYTEQIRKGRRAEVRAVMLEASQWMERFFTENQRYSSNSVGTATSDATLFPSAFRYSPKSTSAVGNHEITLTINASTPNAYTLTGAPIGAMADDKCGSYVLNQTSARGNTGYTGFADATTAARECWR